MGALREFTGPRGDGEGRGDSPQWRPGRLLVGLLAATVGILTLAGCGGEGEPTASSTTAEDTPAATTSNTTIAQTITPSPVATTAEETVAATASVRNTITCEHPDGYALTYPADWQTYSNAEDPDLDHLAACSVFGTAPLELKWGTSMPWLPIRVWVWDGLPFEGATSPEFRGDNHPSRDVEMEETSVAGRPAVRLVSLSEAPQDAIPSDYDLPGGIESVWWIVDLSTDTTDRVLLGRAIPPAAAFTGVTEADKAAAGATSVDSTAEVLDAMMGSLILTD